MPCKIDLLHTDACLSVVTLSLSFVSLSPVLFLSSMIQNPFIVTENGVRPPSTGHKKNDIKYLGRALDYAKH